MREVIFFICLCLRCDILFSCFANCVILCVSICELLLL